MQMNSQFPVQEDDGPPVLYVQQKNVRRRYGSIVRAVVSQVVRQCNMPPLQTRAQLIEVPPSFPSRLRLNGIDLAQDSSYNNC